MGKQLYHSNTLVEAPQHGKECQPQHDGPKSAQDSHPECSIIFFSGILILLRLLRARCRLPADSSVENITMIDLGGVASMTECTPIGPCSQPAQ